MKFKPTVMLHGSVLKPLKEGQKAHYCQNGLWHSTSKVMRVLEQTNEHVKFETEAVCYCINFYGDSAGMVKQESYLLFLRKKNAPQKPYYTLEVEPDGTVRQKRTYFNRQNPDIKQAEKFLLRWQKQLSRKLNKEDKILSLKSRDLRKKEIEDLREKKIKVNGFGFTGKLLADILEEDLMENAA